MSSREKLPGNFRPVTLRALSTSVELKWITPQLNGVIQKYVVVVAEIDLELEIGFDFNSQLATSANLSVLDSPSGYRLVYFPADSVIGKKLPVVNTVLIRDMKPMQTYSIQVHCCNYFGCIRGDEARVTTLDAGLEKFQDPVVFVMDKRGVEIVWEDPGQVNGRLTRFVVYRNNLVVAEFHPSRLLSNAAGFYTYVDSTVHPGTFYSYHIEAFNENYSARTGSVRVHTPRENFVDECGSNSTGVVSSTSIFLLDTLRVNVSVVDWNEVRLVYSVREWEAMLSCIVRREGAGGNRSASTFSAQILLQGKGGGLQVIEFPYPDSSVESAVVRYGLGGLRAYSYYSIRISLTSVYPYRQVLTSKPVYVRTWGELLF